MLFIIATKDTVKEKIIKYVKNVSQDFLNKIDKKIGVNKSLTKVKLS